MQKLLLISSLIVFILVSYSQILSASFNFYKLVPWVTKSSCVKKLQSVFDLNEEKAVCQNETSCGLTCCSRVGDIWVNLMHSKADATSRKAGVRCQKGWDASVSATSPGASDLLFVCI